jgi:hypothetical protein
VRHFYQQQIRKFIFRYSDTSIFQLFTISPGANQLESLTLQTFSTLARLYEKLLLNSSHIKTWTINIFTFKIFLESIHIRKEITMPSFFATLIELNMTMFQPSNETSILRTLIPYIQQSFPSLKKWKISIYISGNLWSISQEFVEELKNLVLVVYPNPRLEIIEIWQETILNSLLLLSHSLS